MVFKAISEKSLAKYIFTQGLLTNDENRANYSPEEFEIAWKKWIGFYVLYDNTQVVAFCGIRMFDEKYARILDRYFVSPEYRNSGLAPNQWSTLMVDRLVRDTISQGYVPFFSIQTEKKRPAIQLAAKVFNKYIDGEFKVLDGLYCTVGNCKDDPKVWQNVATISPYKISLEKKI